MKADKLASKLRNQALKALWQSDIDIAAPDAAVQLRALVDAARAADDLYTKALDMMNNQTDDTGASALQP